MKTIRTEIIIDATKEQVWNVLTDFSSYSEWNPFIVKSKGEARLGGKLENSMKKKDKVMVFKPIIIKLKEKEELEWLGSLFFKGLFDGYHSFTIEEVDVNKVKVIQSESFKGILSGPILKSIKEETTKGFIAMNKALAKRVEQLNN